MHPAKTVLASVTFLFFSVAAFAAETTPVATPEHPLAAIPLRSLGPALTSGRVADFSFHPLIHHKILAGQFTDKLDHGGYIDIGEVQYNTLGQGSTRAKQGKEQGKSPENGCYSFQGIPPGEAKGKGLKAKGKKDIFFSPLPLALCRPLSYIIIECCRLPVPYQVKLDFALSLQGSQGLNGLFRGIDIEIVDPC